MLGSHSLEKNWTHYSRKSSNQNKIASKKNQSASHTFFEILLLFSCFHFLLLLGLLLSLGSSGSLLGSSTLKLGSLSLLLVLQTSSLTLDAAGELGLASKMLGTHDTATDGLHGASIAVDEVLLGTLDEVSEVLLVLGINIDDSEGSGSLVVDDLTEAGLALNDDVGDTFLAAEGREPHDELNGVNVVSDDDELGLLLLNKTGDVVETELDEEGLLGVSGSLSAGLGLGKKTLLLGGLGLRRVLLEKSEKSLS